MELIFPVRLNAVQAYNELPDVLDAKQRDELRHMIGSRVGDRDSDCAQRNSPSGPAEVRASILISQLLGFHGVVEDEEP